MVFLLSPISPLSPAPGDEMFYTPQHAREGTPRNDKNGGSGFSFPPGGGAGGGAGSGGSVYVTPRSTPRYIDGGASTDGGVDSRRGAYAHQVGTWGAVSKSFCASDVCLFCVVGCAAYKPSFLSSVPSQLADSPAVRFFRTRLDFCSAPRRTPSCFSSARSFHESWTALRLAWTEDKAGRHLEGA